MSELAANLPNGTSPLNPLRWGDYSWWRKQIDWAITTKDPALCNLRITLTHYQLSLALSDLLGEGEGPNFHTWAVWGSKKAGITIRQEDLPLLRPLSALGGAGLLGALALFGAKGRGNKWLTASLGVAMGARSFLALADYALDHSSKDILQGNITVLEDIGDATARFIAAFWNNRAADPTRLEEFIASLRPGATASGGQDLLKEGFRNYYKAWRETDLNCKHEFMLLANLKIILHEHYRLQPFIAASMPLLLRRLITADLLSFDAGSTLLRVHKDVLAWRDERTPDDLQVLENADLQKFLCGPGGWDRTPDSVIGSAAHNWANIQDRMNYICDLFRYRAFDPSLFAAPYTDAQCAAIYAGNIPGGPL